MNDGVRKAGENRVKFLSALGECITEWAYVERQIFKLFKAALNTDQRLAGSIFWAMPSLSMRLSYNRNLVQTCLRPEPLLGGAHAGDAEKEWQSLCSDVEKLLKFRNQIAHQPRASAGQTAVLTAGQPQNTRVEGEPDTIIYANPDDPKQTFGEIRIANMLSHLDSLKKILERFEAFEKTFASARKI